MAHSQGIDRPSHNKESAAQSPINRPLVFLTVTLALLMMSIDGTIVATALHAIRDGLGTSINWAGWTLTAYSFGFVLMLPISGKLSERMGRRRVFLASVVIFTLASWGCGQADSIAELIVLRALQAAGGAGFTPSATGIIVDHFGQVRDRYVSLFGSIFPIGAMIGPLFGGFLVAWASWRYVFYVNVPIGLIILVLAYKLIPHDKPRAGKVPPPMDVVGAVLLGGTLLAGMLAASAIGEAHAPLNTIIFSGLLLVAILGALGFFRHIHRSKSPFILPHLIHGSGFGTVNLVNLIFSGTMIGAMALVPLYAVNRYHLDVLSSGTLLTAQGVAAIIFSLTAVWLLRRTGYRLPLYLGSVFTISGLLLLASPPQAGLSPYVWLACATFLVGAGGGTINPSTRNAGMQLAPEHASTLAALRTLSLQIGAITTISTTTAILAGSNAPAIVMAWVFFSLALLRLIAVPLIARVPEQRGAW